MREFRKLLSAVIIGAAGSMAISAPVQAQEVVLKVAHFLPAGSPSQQHALMPWCNELKNESKGRIDCQYYPAMQLGGTPDQLVNQVKNDVADVVWTAPSYSPGRFLRIEAFELPFVVHDAISGARAVWKYYEKYAQEDFKDYKVLAFHVDGGQAIHTGSKPVVSMDDWKGLKLRASTRLGTQTLTALGGAPVGMPPSQLTESISKGIVDGAMGSWELVISMKLGDVTRSHSEPPEGQAFQSATVLMVLMNKHKYESLPPDLRAIIDKNSGPALSERFGQVFQDENANGRKTVLAHGDKINQYTPAMLEQMRKATTGVRDQWIKQMSGKGIDGGALAAAAQDISSKEFAAKK